MTADQSLAELNRRLQGTARSDTEPKLLSPHKDPNLFLLL